MAGRGCLRRSDPTGLGVGTGVGSEGPPTWNYMVQTSAIHGVNKIWSAPMKPLKALWLLCLLTMSGVMVYQLVRLTTVFMSAPVKTSVSLAFSPLRLPAITFCNSNPVRRSRVRDLNCQLQALLRVDKRYKSQECVNETIWLAKDPVLLCERYNMFCTANNTEDVDMFQLRMKRTQFELARADRQTMMAAGHQIEDMIINCTFDGIRCFTRSFIREWTMEYGNCYTMNTTNMRVLDSGPPSGLDMVIDLETEDLLTSYKTGHGLRVVVHEQNTRPFPSSEGFTISAGFETHFGLRVEEISRLGGRYGNCRQDDSGLFDDIKFKYSTKACRTLCLEQAELKRCGCTDAIARVATPSPGVPICTTPTELNCTLALNKDYMDVITQGGVFCPCGNPCREQVYRVRLSSRTWPFPSYIAVLDEEVCRRTQPTDQDVARCRLRKANVDQWESTSSYVRLRVYFETLNYEQVTEEPFYDAERFLSDIGGTLGLWIGASLLGLGEALEVAFFALLLLFKHLRRGAITLNAVSGPSPPSANNAFNHKELSVSTTRSLRTDSQADLVDEITASV